MCSEGFHFCELTKWLFCPRNPTFKKTTVSINYKLNKLTAGPNKSEQVLKWVAHFVRLRLTFPSHSTSCTCCHYYYRRSDHLEDWPFKADFHGKNTLPKFNEFAPEKRWQRKVRLAGFLLGPLVKLRVLLMGKRGDKLVHQRIGGGFTKKHVIFTPNVWDFMIQFWLEHIFQLGGEEPPTSQMFGFENNWRILSQPWSCFSPCHKNPERNTEVQEGAVFGEMAVENYEILVDYIVHKLWDTLIKGSIMMTWLLRFQIKIVNP